MVARETSPSWDNRCVPADLVTVVGVVANGFGYATFHVDGSLRSAGDAGPGDYRAVQPAVVPIILEHDLELVVGKVTYLERDDRVLYAVGRVRRDVSGEGVLSFSPGWAGRRTGGKRLTGLRLEEVSLTRDPASVGVGRVWFLESRAAGGWPAGIRQVTLAELDAATLEAWYGQLIRSGAKDGGGLSAKTVTNTAGVLSVAFGDAVRLKLLRHNPAGRGAYTSA